MSDQNKSSKTKLTPAHAKRVIQDWIEDEDHVRSLQHWPDLAEAYEALKTFSESSFETPAPQGWMCACGTFNYAACCQECNTMRETETGRCPECSRWLEQRCPVCGPVKTAAVEIPAPLVAWQASHAIALEQRNRLARWIIQRGQGLRDHACPQCMPEGGDLVKPDFVCSYHLAEFYLRAAVKTSGDVP